MGVHGTHIYAHTHTFARTHTTYSYYYMYMHTAVINLCMYSACVTHLNITGPTPAFVGACQINVTEE